MISQFKGLKNLVRILLVEPAWEQGYQEQQLVDEAYRYLSKQEYEKALFYYMQVYEMNPSQELEGSIIFCMNILGQYKDALEYKGKYSNNRELMINKCFSYLMLGDFEQAQSLVNKIKVNSSIVQEINTILVIQQNQQNSVNIDSLELQNPIQKCVIYELRQNKRQLSANTLYQLFRFLDQRGVYLQQTIKLIRKIEDQFNSSYTLAKHRIKTLKIYSLVSLVFPKSIHYQKLTNLHYKIKEIQSSQYIDCILKLMKLFLEKQINNICENLFDNIHLNFSNLDLESQFIKINQQDHHIELAYGCYKLARKQILQRETQKQRYQKILLQSNIKYYRDLGQLYESQLYFQCTLFKFIKRLNIRLLQRIFLQYSII